MDWVETTGRTVEEATEAALDELGVAEDDAEVEILEEPRPGLFGRTRGEARVRARVRPTQPRPKEDRRDRRRRGRAERPERPAAGDGTAAGDSAAADGGDEGSEEAESPAEKPARSPRPARAPREAREPRAPARSGASRARTSESQTTTEVDGVDEEVTLEEQGAEAADFLKGLLERMELPAEVTAVVLDDENVEVQVEGENLGILIGPKGLTLTAVQEVTRTVVQRQLGAHYGRLLVDISGYRQKRKVALERFTAEVAEQVRSSGQRRVLEPMTAADRKIVHDAANGIEGVSTISEGEDPRRRVVVLPAD